MCQQKNTDFMEFISQEINLKFSILNKGTNMQASSRPNTYLELIRYYIDLYLKTWYKYILE